MAEEALLARDGDRRRHETLVAVLCFVVVAAAQLGFCTVLLQGPPDGIAVDRRLGRRVDDGLVPVHGLGGHLGHVLGEHGTELARDPVEVRDAVFADVLDVVEEPIHLGAVLKRHDGLEGGLAVLGDDSHREDVDEVAVVVAVRASDGVARVAVPAAAAVAVSAHDQAVLAPNDGRAGLACKGKGVVSVSESLDFNQGVMEQILTAKG